MSNILFFVGMFLGTFFGTILTTITIIHKLEKGGLTHVQIENLLFK